MEDLIEKNMGLILKIVNRFNPRTQTDRDAYIQAGRIGLWKALLTFSKHGGIQLSGKSLKKLDLWHLRKIP